MHAFDRLSRVRPRQRRNCGKGHPFHSKFVSARPAAGSGPADLVRVTRSRQASSGAASRRVPPARSCFCQGLELERLAFPAVREEVGPGAGPGLAAFRLSRRDAVSLSAPGGWERDPPVPIKTLAMWPRNLHARPRRPSSLCAASVGKNLFRAGRAGRETKPAPRYVFSRRYWACRYRSAPAPCIGQDASAVTSIASNRETVDLEPLPTSRAFCTTLMCSATPAGRPSRRINRWRPVAPSHAARVSGRVVVTVPVPLIAPG